MENFDRALHKAPPQAVRWMSLLLALCWLLATPLAMAAATSEFTLSNGMRVIVKEDHRAPTVAHMIWFRIGSMDEVNGTTGVAHALEHMMFKGTKKLKPGEFSARVAELGGRENAFTSKDFTAYFQQIEKSRLPEVMALEADRLENLIVAKDEFEREIKVIMEERRWRTDDQPIQKVYEALHAAAWTAHPYHHPVIGWMNDLQNMTAADARFWHERFYAPNNAVMVITGDVDPQKVKQLAEKNFGHIKRKQLPVTKPQLEPQQEGLRRVTVKAPAENPYVALAFKVPQLRDVEKDDEALALDVLASVLDGYDNARLSSRLIRGERLANSAGASYDAIARGPVLFILDGVPAKGVTTQELEKHLRGEVERVAREGVSEDELKRVKTQLIAGQVYKRDSIFGQAMEIGTMEMSGISHRHIDRIIERLGQVTPQQVQAVAQKYFGDDQLTIATLVPLPLVSKPAPPPAGLRH
jgi:zinc protease